MSRASLRTVGLIVLIGLPPACGNSGYERPADSPEVARPEPLSTAAQESLALELVVPPRVRAGDPVSLTLRARNPTSRPMDLYLRGRTPTVDVVITGAAGDTLWRRLEGEVIPAILHLRALAPGEGFDVSVTWNQRTGAGTPVSPGTYRVRGALLLETTQRETAVATLEIVAR
jgi:hypothetical protein